MSSQLAIATMLKEPAARHESLRRTTPADRTAETAQGGDYCVATVAAPGIHSHHHLSQRTGVRTAPRDTARLLLSLSTMNIS